VADADRLRGRVQSGQVLCHCRGVACLSLVVFRVHGDRRRVVRHVAVEGLERATSLVLLLCDGACRARFPQPAGRRAAGRDRRMTDRQAIENLLEELYAARVRGDLETVTRLFAANATFQVAGTGDASPMPTLVKGNAGITTLMQSMITNFEVSDFTIIEM